MTIALTRKTAQVGDLLYVNPTEMYRQNFDANWRTLPVIKRGRNYLTVEGGYEYHIETGNGRGRNGYTGTGIAFGADEKTVYDMRDEIRRMATLFERCTDLQAILAIKAILKP
jgi:hypothetical protein